MSEFINDDTYYLINGEVEFYPKDKKVLSIITGKEQILQLPASLCLHYLIEHREEVTSQRKLIDIGWGEGNIATPNTFYQGILTLRNALSEVGLPRTTIKTIARRGLILSEEIPVTRRQQSLSRAVQNNTRAVDNKTAVRCPRSRMTFAFATILSLIVLLFIYALFRPSLPFSDYKRVKNPPEGQCSVYAKRDALAEEEITKLTQLQKNICSHNHIYFSAAQDAGATSAVVCDKDVRKISSAHCLTYYSINDEH